MLGVGENEGGLALRALSTKLELLLIVLMSRAGTHEQINSHRSEARHGDATNAVEHLGSKLGPGGSLVQCKRLNKPETEDACLESMVQPKDVVLNSTPCHSYSWHAIYTVWVAVPSFTHASTPGRTDGGPQGRYMCEM
ncbi:hypothetical protein M378DRAFT_172223 [Amanita muscaria Koide BX008]|uniref:Uncharacterized protein n=1 Tax=Amanita muscaria (strain Koide BX008) TaxID=946122 RepID=A0A0C2WK31_AMAMK|nr:hypothetical protein M378DRAFT_172223 [Amanita muscaria Koide BX008]